MWNRARRSGKARAWSETCGNAPTWMERPRFRARFPQTRPMSLRRPEAGSPGTASRKLPAAGRSGRRAGRPPQRNHRGKRFCRFRAERPRRPASSAAGCGSRRGPTQTRRRDAGRGGATGVFVTVLAAMATARAARAASRPATGFGAPHSPSPGDRTIRRRFARSRREIWRRLARATARLSAAGRAGVRARR